MKRLSEISDQQSLDTFEDRQLRVALGSYKPVTDEFLRLAKQLGVDDVLFTPHRHGGFDSAMPLGEKWSEADLREFRDRVNDYNLRLFAFEKMPIPLFEILLAESVTRDEKTAVIKETIRNLGAAGIPVLGYSGHPSDGAVRTTRSNTVPGGAEASGFDQDQFENQQLVEDPIEEETLWKRYEEFLNDVLPVAEESGVTLGAMFKQAGFGRRRAR